MKAKYLTDKLEPRPQFQHMEGVVQRENGKFYWPAGTIEEHPRAYMLVRMGDAEPADDECRLAAAMSTSEQKLAQRHAAAVDKGIHPDDYQAFFDGEMVGYDDDGRPIPGPNAKEEED